MVAPFAAALVDEGAGWLVRVVSPAVALLKIAGFLALQASLAALVLLAIWSVFRGTSDNYRSGENGEPDEDW